MFLSPSGVIEESNPIRVKTLFYLVFKVSIRQTSEITIYISLHSSNLTQQIRINSDYKHYKPKTPSILPNTLNKITKPL